MILASSFASPVIVAMLIVNVDSNYRKELRSVASTISKTTHRKHIRKRIVTCIVRDTFTRVYFIIYTQKGVDTRVFFDS